MLISMETSKDEGKLSFNTRQTPKILTDLDFFYRYSTSRLDSKITTIKYIRIDNKNRRKELKPTKKSLRTKTKMLHNFGPNSIHTYFFIA